MSEIINEEPAGPLFSGDDIGNLLSKAKEPVGPFLDGEDIGHILSKANFIPPEPCNPEKNKLKKKPDSLEEAEQIVLSFMDKTLPQEMYIGVFLVGYCHLRNTTLVQHTYQEMSPYISSVRGNMLARVIGNLRWICWYLRGTMVLSFLKCLLGYVIPNEWISFVVDMPDERMADEYFSKFGRTIANLDREKYRRATVHRNERENSIISAVVIRATTEGFEEALPELARNVG
ncbi:hypothetical protein CASFOL_039484 [Castilleja foliolosa]|uniref:Uncharacterized protein n=1 Tax=Castilleja foliolosa TaxID=1961234 RepID=A0ABD3BI40_9LAMI